MAVKRGLAAPTLGGQNKALCTAADAPRVAMADENARAAELDNALRRARGSEIVIAKHGVHRQAAGFLKITDVALNIAEVNYGLDPADGGQRLIHCADVAVAVGKNYYAHRHLRLGRNFAFCILHYITNFPLCQYFPRGIICVKTIWKRKVDSYAAKYSFNA